MCAADISERFALSARALSDKGGCRGRGCSDERERDENRTETEDEGRQREKKVDRERGKEKNVRVCMCTCRFARRARETIQGEARDEEKDWTGEAVREEEERCRPRSYRKSLRSGVQQSARWSCPARLQTGSGRGVAAELNYYKLPRHSYRMHAPAGARKSSTLRQPSTSRTARCRLMLLSLA